MSLCIIIYIVISFLNIGTLNVTDAVVYARALEQV